MYRSIFFRNVRYLADSAVVFGYFSLRVNMAYDNYVVDVTRDCVINLSLPNGAYSGNGRFELKRRPLV